MEEINRQLLAFGKQITAARKDYPYPAVIIDAPLLIESRLNEICDVVIAVLADAELRAARISIRDNISLQDAMLRINAQKDNNFYAEHADFLLYNGGDKNEVFLQTDLILQTIFENVSGV
ncbi:Dephospho-CoA kinase [bioreactor metagenome]|uniref:Dephospho-CoA kinase n=1 Tax=bioreactor metagenome TaxID=1076179 RepID=A0A645IRT6_9ZZZZ